MSSFFNLSAVHKTAPVVRSNFLMLRSSLLKSQMYTPSAAINGIAARPISCFTFSVPLACTLSKVLLHNNFPVARSKHVMPSYTTKTLPCPLVMLRITSPSSAGK